MRIMGFSKKWDKLSQEQFTTFRAPRKDTDWYLGEQVQVVFQPRSKNREPLFNAEIIAKEPKTFKLVTEAEAMADGFDNAFQMWEFLKKAHKGITMDTPFNKLTLRRIEFSKVEKP